MLKIYTMCHNPYFNRWFSAILLEYNKLDISQCHNPYFNRWFSAIIKYDKRLFWEVCHNPYFNRWFSAMRIIKEDKKAYDLSQSLF